MKASEFDEQIEMDICVVIGHQGKATGMVWEPTDLNGEGSKRRLCRKKLRNSRKAKVPRSGAPLWQNCCAEAIGAKKVSKRHKGVHILFEEKVDK